MTRKWILLLVGVVAVSIGMLGWAATAAQAGSTTTLTGTMTKTGTKYFLNGTELDFGAQWWIESTTASADYDGDGSTELIVAELDGLVGTSVTVIGKLAGGEMDVYTLGGMHYRDPGKPPWAGPHGPGGHP